VRMPRDVSGADLVKALERLGYRPTRQTGSHLRLTTTVNGEHHITVPNHDPCAWAPWPRSWPASPPIIG